MKLLIMFNFQNAGRPVMEEIHLFHDCILIIINMIALGSGLALYLLTNQHHTNRATTEAQAIEFAWTILPAFVVAIISYPSLRLLYMVDDAIGVRITVKALGHQWYWLYDYPDGPRFNSYLLPGRYRLLETDMRLTLPASQITQILVTAADVLHSWTVPTMAVKADAIPGRVNKLSLVPKRPGIYYGQCREICGSNHTFIPIRIEVVFILNTNLKFAVDKEG